MEYTMPHYYQSFECVAGKCPATCCAGWEIVIDKRKQEQYADYPGSFGKRLHRCIDWKQGIFKQNGTRCAFLNEQNLCDIYTEGGNELLCRTCRRYPRHYEEFENLREISLSASCPEVARLLLEMEESVTFKTVYQERDEETYEEFDFFLFTKLQDARELMFEIIQRRSLSLRLRMRLLLMLAHDVQKRIREKRLAQVDELLERYRKKIENCNCKELEIYCEKQCRWLVTKNENSTGGPMRLRHGMFSMLYRMECLHKDWRKELKGYEKILFHKGEEQYHSVIRFYHAKTPDWERQAEQLLVYFLFTYFCGAVYDEDALGKVKAAVVHTLLLEELFAAKAFQTKEEYNIEKQTECLYRYAREIEHSDRNLRRVEEYMKHDKACSLEHLFCILND